MSTHRPSPDEPLTLPGLPPFSSELSNRLRAAAREVSDDIAARAHHRDEAGRPRFVNRLVEASSPYLLQHAFNPVSWHPWGEEAFALARTTGRPILLSVGYSTCHWCHVMERESFEDLEIAELLNAHFVPIKVDREERPDVDAVYMMATQLMSGSGGWPMTVVMTSDLRPFFAGTYFPARDGDRGARIGLLTLLRRLLEVWEQDHERVLKEAERLTRALEGANRPAPPEGIPGDAALHEAARFLARTFDPVWGGFGSAPKFPRPCVYELLLRYHRRSGDPTALHIVSHSLERMSAGGIYDHLGGGFARYATDREWLVPHFEKMLYDNAQLARVLTDAWRVTGSPTLRRPLVETLDYVIREMTAPGGGFYSATDADSEGVEGKYFVWDLDEIRHHLGPERGDRFAEVYGVTPNGNFEGRNILHLPRSIERVAEDRGVTTDTLLAELRADRQRLLEARTERIPPFLDDKVLTEWNGQMIGALAAAGFALDQPRYTRAAIEAADFVLERLAEPDGRLLRTTRDGRSSGRAVLEDYAFFADGLLDLFEATADVRWLEAARRTVDHAIAHFADAEGGGFFATSDLEPSLIVRDKPSYDGAQPSGNSVMALALLRLAAFTDASTYRAHADATLAAFGGLLEKGATANPKLALALDWRLEGAKEVLVVTTPDDEGKDLVEVLRRTFVPNAVELVGDASTLSRLSAHVPWLSDKPARDGKATAYVCVEGVCRLPTHDPRELRGQLEPEARIEAPRLPMRAARNE